MVNFSQERRGWAWLSSVNNVEDGRGGLQLRIKRMGMVIFSHHGCLQSRMKRMDIFVFNQQGRVKRMDIVFSQQGGLKKMDIVVFSKYVGFKKMVFFSQLGLKMIVFNH